MIDRLIQLNRWLQVYDLEQAKAKACGGDVPEWYKQKAREWMEERDYLVWGE